MKNDYILNILTESINQISFDEFINLFKNGILVEEIQHKIFIPETLIKYIQQNLKEQFITKIDKEVINSFFNDGFKHLEDLYIVNMDFTKIEQFQQFAFQLTNLQNLTIPQKYALNFIKIKLHGTNGLFTNFNKHLNANVMIFNKHTYTEQTIRHECIHYFQTYQKYGLTKNIRLKNVDYKQFDYFPQKINHQLIIKSLFNKKEFNTTIDNLISYLNILYQKYFKHISLREFIILFIKEIANKTIFKSEIIQAWKKQNFSFKEIYFILYAREINKHLYDKILLYLTNIKGD